MIYLVEGWRIQRVGRLWFASKDGNRTREFLNPHTARQWCKTSGRVPVR